MAAVDVTLIRGEDQLSPIGEQRDVLHFEFAWCQFRRLAASDGHRIQMHPSGALPGKRDAIASAPKELALAVHEAPERAAYSWLCAPDLAASARVDVGYANRPGRCRSRCAAASLPSRRRQPKKRDAGPVQRPDRLLITIEGWIEEEQCVGVG